VGVTDVTRWDSDTHANPFIACDQPVVVIARMATCSSSSELIPSELALRAGECVAPSELAAIASAR
jgi:hypothetical protein